LNSWRIASRRILLSALVKNFPFGADPIVAAGRSSPVQAHSVHLGRSFGGSQKRFFSRTQISLLMSVNTKTKVSGGADRDRTGGLLVANQALSQLSYSPNPVVRLWSFVVRKSQRPTTRDQRPIRWWAWVELNYRPHPYQGCALAT
jgi:hypothetical protein